METDDVKGSGDRLGGGGGETDKVKGSGNRHGEGEWIQTG